GPGLGHAIGVHLTRTVVSERTNATSHDTQLGTRAKEGYTRLSDAQRPQSVDFKLSTHIVIVNLAKLVESENPGDMQNPIKRNLAAFQRVGEFGDCWPGSNVNVADRIDPAFGKALSR